MPTALAEMMAPARPAAVDKTPIARARSRSSNRQTNRLARHEHRWALRDNELSIRQVDYRLAEDRVRLETMEIR